MSLAEGCTKGRAIAEPLLKDTSQLILTTLNKQYSPLKCGHLANQDLFLGFSAHVHVRTLVQSTFTTVSGLIWSKIVFVAIPGRNQTLFCCVFLLHYRV